MHDHLRVDRFTLLRSGEVGLPTLPEPITVLDVDDESDPDGQLRRRYRIDRGVVLVRPDGHIGYCGTDVQGAVGVVAAAVGTYDRQS